MLLSLSPVPAPPPTSLQVVIRAAQTPEEPAAPDDTAQRPADAAGQTLDITT